MGLRKTTVIVDRGTTVLVILPNKPVSPVPGGTSTFREFSKRRNDSFMFFRTALLFP
jgi:hypothetical protein